tara:strand:- start:3745 stop:4248 length:504 start_codon:yes stop_codon:yes gene_type:complete
MTTLNDLTNKAEELLELEKLMDKVQAELKEVKNKYQKVSEEDIPSMLSELGLSEITMNDGSKISTSQYYSARITPDKTDEAFAWLNSNGHGDIIKNTVSVSFGREENDSALKLTSELHSKGLDPAQKKWVEPMTLKAFVREQVESGNDLPLETFNVYIGQKTRIIKK